MNISDTVAKKTDDNIKYILTKKTNLLSEILYDELDINSVKFNFLIKFGAIYNNNERSLHDSFINENSLLRIHTDPRRFNCDYDWKSLIVFENDFVLVLNKPSGVPSHPVTDNIIENSLFQVSQSLKINLFVTHRLDTLTSGLIVYAKKKQFVKDFNMQLQNRTIHKKYVALVESDQIFSQKITHYMNPEPGRPKKLSDQFTQDWPICELEILDQKILSQHQLQPKSWVKINLLTGRTHQIRSQLSHLNAPILGDLMYGSQQIFNKNAIALRSYEIEFMCNNIKLKFSLSEYFEPST